MKKIIWSIILILMTSFTDVGAQNIGNEIDFQVSKIDPTGSFHPIKKSPIVIPSVNLVNHTLLFTTPCDGSTLQVVNGEGEVVYATLIPVGTESLNLPTYLSGEYQLQIIRGNYCFWGYINL